MVNLINSGKVLVVGGTGIVASHLLDSTDYLATSTTGKEGFIPFDLKKPEHFDYEQWGDGDCVVLLAAISSPDECVNNYENAYKINVTGTSYFISRMLDSGVRVLFFSSDVVYGDNESIVDEKSPLSPFGEYAKMKQEVEQEFLGNPLFKVFRLSYVLSKKDSYYLYLKLCESNNTPAEVFHPLSRFVVSVYDVVDAVISLMANWSEYSPQITNLCGSDSVSRVDIADEYIRAANSSLKYEIVAISDEFWKARPKNVNICSKYLHGLIGRAPLSLEQMVKRIVIEDSEK